MQRHYWSMFIVFAAALVGVVGLGPLGGMGIGVATALALAPWSNALLRRWLAMHVSSLWQSEEAAEQAPAVQEMERWRPVSSALHYAMDVEGMDVSMDLGDRELTDVDIQQIIALEKEGERAGIRFELAESVERPHDGPVIEEPVIDMALRRRQPRTIALPSRY